MKRFTSMVVLLVAVLFFGNPVFAQTVDFEDLVLEAESYWDGSDGSGGFESRGVSFSNNYNMTWGSWDGFAYANLTDTTLSGFDAQYNAIPGAGARGSKIYAVAYVSSFAEGPPTITFDKEQRITGFYATNSNYAYYSMRDGDAFAKKFTEADWFKLTIAGIDATGAETGIVGFKLADGRNIVNDWTWVDLSSLGPVKQLTFSLSSTDMGDWGMNTPAYFCLDNLNEDRDNDDSTCFINSIRR
ncbi:MAG: DUF4465 domain-containing protein [Desulfobacteraceae bacterium]|nr:MAG: DUF4465 domain-containing protein [Desulfobacteraceae bacterium]